MSSITFSRASLKSQIFAIRPFSTSKNEFKVNLKKCSIYKLPDGPNTSISISKSDLLKNLRNLMVIRRMELSCAELYQSRFIRGFCHLYIGQEAVSVGIDSISQPQDTFITSYRCHSHVYLKGASVKSILCELMGRQNGVSKGKGGSMHMYQPNFYGGNGIVGAQIPLGTGLAFAHKYKEDNGVCFASYGDGAANQGQLFESFNMAMLWSLPVVYVCENNKYGMGTSQERSSANYLYYTRGDYIPGVQVDGMDFLAVREAARYCAEHARTGKGPIILETLTYRYVGHSVSDPGTSYRTRDEVSKIRNQSDTIVQLKNVAMELGILKEEEFQTMETEIQNEIDEAIEYAKASPEPNIESMYHHVYAQPIEKVILSVLVLIHQRSVLYNSS